MKSNISSFFSFPLAALSILLLLVRPIAAQSPAPSPDLVSQVCAGSAHTDICVASLRSDPKSEHADLFELALIALRLAASNATNTSGHIKELLSAKNAEPTVEQNLIDCSEQYIDAVQQLDDSIVALLAKAYNDVYTWVKAAIADVESCEAEFKAQQGDVASDMSHRNTMFRHLCNNVIAITKNLAGM